ncbi:uncharacterized protein [Physcomitrium patens]|uniref:GPI ethanolamine phosphate transferase 1 n=1 Tax=Physcomitrium patens TaxID=3218 RepID=A0A2K1J565_PHYPA|nr:GPI ethanolamine phosphate transferase 1-like isoform X2 [Physcomitrium patens]PNR36650.1 hypothetical protein PHYPA_022501 [Physcomitrium patens]|eukprot:XP_024401012.1 GPI ethanolamine phosphate transferase 1-like isoform X2 [Physcomitrella patens]
MEQRRRRELALVVLGVVLHSLYMLSIFDIYFKSPIVSGMNPEPLGIKPPANRVVLFIADGMRADKFFERDRDGQPRAPFLHNIMHNKGRWGLSHARPPTESRPGHVAIIAGFYEDPSAVTKGWKANPVEFDSVFNRSRHTVAFGSPDIVPIFCSALPHTYTDSYSTEFEDFATDASFLDEWAFDRLERFLKESQSDPKIQKDIKDDGLIIFLHLLGCDTNGHAHRPYSDIYLNNINLVDRGIESTVKLIEEYFPDGKTAYVFTSDHGMSNKGSHGDGDPQNTETPIVVWGSGVRGPEMASPEDDVDDGLLFVDQHRHHENTPASWGLKHIERTDINQGDIAPLMSTLLGLPCPLNSVGTLPVEFLALDKRDQARAMFGNAKQVLDQVLRKSQLKQATSLFFKPFMPLVEYESMLASIDQLVSSGQFESALESAQELIKVALEGLHYFQTYDWLFLMSTVIMGYLGWMVYVFLHILETYTKFPLYSHRKAQRVTGRESGKRMVRLSGGLLMGACSLLLLFERAPPLYHAYLGLAMFFWTEIFAHFRLLQNVGSVIQTTKFSWFQQVIITSVISFIVLELLVASFFIREVYTGIFSVAGVVGAVVVSCNMRDLSMVPAFVWASCWFLSAFTMMPTQIADNTALVVGSGILVVMVASIGRWLDYINASDPYWKLKFCTTASKLDKSWLLLCIQVLLVLASSGMVWVTTSYRAQKKGLPFIHQAINWFLAGFSMLLPLKSPRGILPRLLSIFLGFAPLFLLLSIGYEALFYTALELVLFSWILVESAICHSVVPSSSPKWERLNSNYLPESTGRQSSNSALCSIELHHTRVALCFLVLINVAFFGTGNMASVASFEISSVYRFITIFDPFIMGALLLCKIFVPFILVTCAFSAVTRILELPRLGCYFVVLLLSDVMTIHFFFLVKNTGSWMDIGQSISHFGIMSAQVVFVLILFALSSVFTHDLDLLSSEQRSSLARLQTSNDHKYH